MSQRHQSIASPRFDGLIAFWHLPPFQLLSVKAVWASVRWYLMLLVQSYPLKALCVVGKYLWGSTSGGSLVNKWRREKKGKLIRS